MILNNRILSRLLLALALTTIAIALQLTVTDLVTMAPAIHSGNTGRMVQGVARVLPEVCLLLAAVSALPSILALRRHAERFNR